MSSGVAALAHLTSSPEQIVANGALPLAIFFAALAGVVSFASPCVLPLVPGFLAYVTGLTDEKRRTRLVLGACLFVLGFSVVFVGIQAAVSLVYDTVGAHRSLLTRIGGVIVILMGLMFLGVVGQRGFTVRWRPTAGLVGAPLLGAAFGLGMAPCISPVLGTLVAANTSLNADSQGRALFLTVCYALGMGLPFILIAAGWSRAEKASKWLRDHHRPIQIVGGTLMIAMGLLMVSGLWEELMALVQSNLVNQFETVI